LFLGDNTTHEIYGQGMVTIRLLNGIEKKILSICMFSKIFIFFCKTFNRVRGELHIKQGWCTLINELGNAIIECPLNYDLSN
jgi:hypothetical protein